MRATRVVRIRSVIPAQAGIQRGRRWIPALAGMTGKVFAGMTGVVQEWTAGVACMVVLVIGATALPAQQAVADSLWRMGRRNEAVGEYLRVIASDSNAVRANFRVAQDLAARNVDSALVFLRAARARVPSDPDLLYTEATYLAWARRFDAAVARYDSLLATHPDFDYVRVARARALSWKGDLASAARGFQQVLDRAGSDRDARRDAEFGLAQVAAWLGNLSEASDLYGSLLADDPTEVRSLLGLAAVRNWQGRPNAARDLLDRVMVREAGNADAAQLLETVSRSRSPALDINASWSHDSDGNNVAWQTASQTFLLHDGLRLWASAGSQSARDPIRRTSRLLGEVGVTTSKGLVQLTAQIGARQLDVSEAPSGVGSHTEMTWRASASARVRTNLTLGVGASHVPFDEIASLLARGITITNYDGTVEWRPLSATTLALSGGVLDLSDGNRRTAIGARVFRRFRSAVTLGALARTFSFARDGDGYFTPERFILADLYGSWEREISRWSLGLSGGGGIQSLGPDDPTQAEWHVDARIGLRIAANASLGVFGGTSTSAAASAVGAFRYQTAGLSAHIVF